MKIVKIIIQVAIIYAFYLIGNWIHDLFNLTLPGSILAMLLLFICLSLKIIPMKLTETGAGFLLSTMTLFFIPQTVGIMNFFSFFKGKGLLLIVATLISTLMVMVTSGLTSQFLAKKREVEKS